MAFMARIGVNYETVKHTAIKLLSQGESPSVQKIREVLGTGSNTTIAQYLKVWREDHKNKEIHHLPANMPKELIAAIEVLWQAAMEQAQNQLVVIKQDLDKRSEQMQQEKLTLETNFNEIKNRLTQALQKLDDKNQEIQLLHTEIAIAQEKLSNASNELTTTKTQYDLKLNHLTAEKYTAIEKADSLEKEMMQLQKKRSEQISEHQIALKEERVRQEQSEKRWLNLIDQAKTEAKNQRKNYEQIINNQSKKIETMQTSMVDLQHKVITQQATLEHQNGTIIDLKEQLNKVNAQYIASSELIASIQGKQEQNAVNQAKQKSSKNFRKNAV
jgi:chromosome segregation ATPase